MLQGSSSKGEKYSILQVMIISSYSTIARTYENPEVRQRAVSVISSRDLLESIGSNPAEYAEKRNKFVLNERYDFFALGMNALKWTPQNSKVT